jgi:hypothetical protein
MIDGADLKSPAAADWEPFVLWTLKKIGTSETGKAVLQAIQQTGKQMRIKPYTPAAAAATGACNAYAQPQDWTAATAKGKPVGGAVGTGAGSNAEIRYSSPMWGYGGTCAGTAPPTAAGTSPPALLFHEMVHGLRQMAGLSFGNKLTGVLQNYDNEEEFFAILVSNIFVTDPTNAVPNRTLRADHHGFTTLAAAQATTAGFLAVQDNRALVGKVVAQQVGLALALAKVRATFNPIQGYANQFQTLSNQVKGLKL